jgi:hypothetical protein
LCVGRRLHGSLTLHQFIRSKEFCRGLNFYKSVTLGRVVFYGFLAAAAVAALGYVTGDHGLYIFAPFAGGAIGFFGFALCWSRDHVKPVQAAPGQPARFPKWVYWMFYGALAVSSALKLWDIMHKK